MSKALALDSYRLLGRSGLRVSPLALGTMTFGEALGWGTSTDECRRIFDSYVDRGGNFIDTANQYALGTSEQLVGAFAAGRRDELVVATKYTLPIRVREPNSGGNHRKSMVQSVERSLRHLATDYVDLFYLHAWDATTPVEEVLRGMDDLVRAGKVLYLGVSNIPAWQVSRMQATADIRGWSPLVALQISYSLAERSPERDLIPMAQEMGLGVVPWSPLGGGVLTGKYLQKDIDESNSSPMNSDSRKSLLLSIGALSKKTLQTGRIVANVSEEIGKSPAQVALAWMLHKPGIVSPVVGARTLSQFEENLGALDVQLTEAQRLCLEKAADFELGFPHDYLAQTVPRIYKPWRIDN